MVARQTSFVFSLKIRLFSSSCFFRAFKMKYFLPKTLIRSSLIPRDRISFSIPLILLSHAFIVISISSAERKDHNFVDGVDPYVVEGDPTSGLLPFINPDGPGEYGSGDHHVQAYCYRMCLTDYPDNRRPFEKPAGYNELDYELLLRNFEAGETGFPWINSSMLNRKTDTNNRTGFSTDFIGQNYSYPEASYEEEKKSKKDTGNIKRA